MSVFISMLYAALGVGVAEGNSMSAPVCIANAVADALGVAEVSVSLTPERVLEIVRRRGQ